MKKITHYLTPFLTIALLLTLSGCASIVSESKYPVFINSSPPGAQISVINEGGSQVFAGRTPVVATLKSGTSYFNGADYRIIAKTANGQTAHQSLSSSVDGWYVGNLLFGGIIGFLVVDPLTGAMYKLPESTPTFQFLEPLQQREVKATSKDGQASSVPGRMIPSGA